MMDLVLVMTESDITLERFQSLGHHLSKFIRITKESVRIRKEFNSQRIGLDWKTNMVAVLLFWNTNMTDVTSCANALYI